MSDVRPYDELPEDELIAAEYALGVLDAAERAAAAQRIARDSAFARLVEAWERRLAPWAGQLAEVAPPPAVWERIAATLPPPAAERQGLWGSLPFWRIFALASALAAACLAVVVYFGAVSGQGALVASIEGKDTRAFVATIDAKRGTVAVIPAAYVADATRVPELWIIPADGKPRSMGLLRADKPVTLTLSPELAKFANSNVLLAVSLEPPGGSPTGQPTGPVIASGKLTTL